jgi:nuclear pore complex protein Nup133
MFVLILSEPYYQTILESVFEYREYNSGVYGIELPLISPWTSTDQIINALLQIDELTDKNIELSRTELAEPKSQIPRLVAVLFACFNERIEWLSRSVHRSGLTLDRSADKFCSPMAAQIVNIDNERAGRKELFDSLRPDLLEDLRKFPVPPNRYAG